ncbi:MAG: VanW family protein, partial [Actinobacteria bacterium]|nr:VanW family protein [Actinomycetota bacterium]
SALFQSIDATLATAPRKTVFEYDEKADRVRAFAPGSSGQIVDRPALERAILDRAKARTDRRVEIPIVVLNKEYDVAANPLGIKDMLATGSSLFRESPRYRVHNIVAGAKALDGQIIRPGASFSFIERIGPVTLRAGFKEGSAIVEDKTERVVGGGICQVSTTLFRAVYLAGMPIEERWPHLYRVHYYEIGGYPIGLDATVFIPGLDLVFRNDLPGPVMIRSRVDVENYALDFELWGVNDGRSVELVDPAVWGWSDPPPDEAVVDSKQDVKYKKQIEWARKGAVAQITRVITKPGLAPVRETLKTGYKPWPNRFQVGIDVAKDKFPIYYNKWVEENPEEAARWGALKVPGVPSDPKAPAG